MSTLPTCAEIHALAVEKGWWDRPRSDREIAMLICSEVFEAFEAWRNHNDAGLAEELADICIRVGDACGAEGEERPLISWTNKRYEDDMQAFHDMASEAFGGYYLSLIQAVNAFALSRNIDLETAIIAKHEKNKTRQHRHGGKRA